MYVVLLLLPRLMGGKVSNSNFQLFGELPVPPHASGVLETFNLCFFLYNYGILSIYYFYTLMMP